MTSPPLHPHEYRTQVRCWWVTQATAEFFKGSVPFVTAPGHIRPTGTNSLSSGQWCRLYTVLSHYASGYNNNSERWITLKDLDAIHEWIFGERIDTAALKIKDIEQLGLTLYPIVHTWSDAMGQNWIRLVRPATDERPECGEPVHSDKGSTRWSIWNFEVPQPLVRPVVGDMSTAVIQLQRNFEKVYCDPSYVSPLLHKFLQNRKLVFSWIAQTRAEFYALLVTSFPLGIRLDDVIPAYENFYKKKLIYQDYKLSDIKVTKEDLLGHLITDFISVVRETEIHGTVYIRIAADVDIPFIISNSREIVINNQGITVCGKPVQAANLRPANRRIKFY